MITPYEIAVPDERLDAVAARVEAYDWGALPDAGGWSSGVGVDDLARLVRYWRERYDWRAVERRLNERPHFVTEIDGETLHFVHVEGDGTAPPLLLLHGWPGSFTEFDALLDPLLADGHDVVVPSLPGFAFSNPISGVLGPRRIAELMHRLMARLHGDARFVVQGGDWGAHIGSWMAWLDPEPLLGLHLNMVSVLAEDVTPTTEAEKDFAARRAERLDRESAYAHQQGTRPQTLGVALADSPVGVAGWILEKFGVWADLPRREDGSPDLWSVFSEEWLLTDIMLYVAPPSVVTASWIYQGRRRERSGQLPAGARVRVPLGVAAFPDPVFEPPPRSLVERTYDVLQWSDMPSGGHFAAVERPELLLEDLRRFVAKVTPTPGRGDAVPKSARSDPGAGASGRRID